MSAIKKLIKASFPLASAYYLLSDCRARVAGSLGRIESHGGTAHQEYSVEESLGYIDRVFNDYKRYGGVAAFHGRMAEVGPGDNCGVGLLFLNDGCTSADLADRFYSDRNARQQARIYEAMLRRDPGLERWLGGADLTDETSFRGIKRWYGPEAAAEQFFNGKPPYDVIVSRAVFEHLYDPLEALGRMAAALNPGGLLLHKIDLRDHGMFSAEFHELKFLEVPDPLYPWMTRFSGRPNRVMIDRYRSCLSRLGLDFQLLVTRLVGVGDVEPHLRYEDIPPEVRRESLRFVAAHRDRFAKSMRRVSDEDLCVAGVFLVARNVRG